MKQIVGLYQKKCINNGNWTAAFDVVKCNNKQSFTLVQYFSTWMLRDSSSDPQFVLVVVISSCVWLVMVVSGMSL